MIVRLQQLATDWKTYLALIAGLGAIIEALTGVFTKLPALQKAIQDLSSEVRWVTVAVLALVTVMFLYAALSRRSALRKPERFLVSPDDPRYLVGREEHIHALTEECAHAPLVFLIGESGAGKSALVQAGMLPRLRASTALERGAPRLLPLLIDASPIAWQHALQDALTSALRDLSATECSQLGALHPFVASDMLGWLTSLPRDGSRTLLLILDQLDDYILAHQQHFVSGRKVVSPPQLIAANPDWATLAQLIRENRLHAVFVCRTDTAATLDALRFTENIVTYLLPCVEAQLLTPLLDELTQASGNEVVVTDPEDGWVQLK